MINKPDSLEISCDLLTKESPRIVNLFQSMDRVFERMELMSKNCKPILNGEYYLTDKEVSDRLKVSRQTLQEYRNSGKVSFCQLGGKILYRASDIQKMLDNNYKKAYR